MRSFRIFVWGSDGGAGGGCFLATAPIDAHTASLRLALSCTGFWCSFFATRQRTNQENAPGRSLRGLPASRRFTTNGGAFALAKILHLGRISARPRWGCVGKNFCVLVGAFSNALVGKSNFVEKEGKGPHFLRKYLGNSDVLPLTGVGEVVPATLLFLP